MVSRYILILMMAGGAIGVQRAHAQSHGKAYAILESSCVGCHNPLKTKGGLDLSTRELLLKGGDTGPAVLPGNSAKSLLHQMVTHEKSPGMPHKKPKLPDADIKTLAAWIDAGTPYERTLKPVSVDDATAKSDSHWWSFQPLTSPAIPTIKNQKSKIKNPIDAFILARIEKEKIEPSPPADRRTLIRRVTYDLHGLPPTPEEIEAFEKDTDPQAWEKLIDRLLASPRYGERWGRHWLDIVHYGETHGYDKDKRRDNAWPYRDYVIRAFNTDKPYARFIREQIAGDHLFPDDPDGIVATGFIAAGPWDLVGHLELGADTTDGKIARVLDRDDMVANTVGTFMSLTVHCARCHDHKFDPIPQKDYYSLQAVFAGVERASRPYTDSQQIADVRKSLENRKKSAEASRDRISRLVESRKTDDIRKVESNLEKLRLQAAAVNSKGSPSNGYHSEFAPKADITKWVQVDLGQSIPIDEIRLIPARPTDFRDLPGFGFPVRFRVELGEDAAFIQPVIVEDQTAADFRSPRDNAHFVKVGGKTARFVRITATRLFDRDGMWCLALAEMQVLSGGKNLAVSGKASALDSIEGGRWSVRFLVDNFSSRASLNGAGEFKGDLAELQQRITATEAHRHQLALKLLSADERAELDRSAAELLVVDNEIKKLPPPKLIYAPVPRAPIPVHVLRRGDVNSPADLVAPGALTLLSNLSADFSSTSTLAESARRAALAEYIASEKNPLTWRSIVNRVWQYHFGRGIVDTPNDFGAKGNLPTHPQLLDYLATEFQRQGGSFKSLHKLILTSSTYRQSSSTSNQQLATNNSDSDNHLLWRANRRRLDAESIRDSVLAISGKMDYTMGGPGFDLFGFVDDHSPHYDYVGFAKKPAPATWRRTVYRFIVRSVPDPLMEALDCADANQATPIRNNTNTALQALAMLNDPFLIDQAGYIAARATKSAANPADQLAAAHRLILGRFPTDKEREALHAYTTKHGLANTCRLLLNTNEFMFVD